MSAGLRAAGRKRDGGTERGAILAAIVCHGFWGVSFLASRVALNTAPVLVLLSHRFLLAFALMSLLRLLLGIDCRFRGKPVLRLLALGMLEPVIYFFGEQYGILHSNTIFSGVMIAMIPIVSTLAAVPVLGEKPSGGQLFFSALSVGGVIGIGLMSSSGGSLDWIGVLGLAVAVLSAVAYTLLNRSLASSFTVFERTYSMMAQGAAVFTLCAVLSLRGDGAAWLRPLGERSYLISMLFLSVCCSVVSFFLSSFTLTRLPVAQATVFSNLTTAVSVFAGAVFLHEPFTALGLVCSVLILLGIYGVQRAAREK